jgi:hypothetical protein
MTREAPFSVRWEDVEGDALELYRPARADPPATAVYARASDDGVYLTAAQAREIAADLLAYAEAHEAANNTTRSTE